MYLSYDNLWGRMARLGLNKTGLMELTGMSSRTLAKLSKNECVSLETLVKICEVLHCKIEDVMTVSDSFAPVSLYDAYRHAATPEEELENENVTVSKVSYLGKDYLIYVTKKVANRATVIQCVHRSVAWGQLPFNWRLEGRVMGETVSCFSVEPVRRKHVTTVFVVVGKPSYFKGLDDGAFRSARNPGGEEYLHVMSMSAFKAFVPA